MKNLAINGGEKIRKNPFPAHITIGREEQEAVNRVIERGKLSTFLGAWHPDFFGGVEVQELEREWAEKFNVKHAVAVNSATSGLIAAVGALGIGPGDEVIVSPYTMSATATAITVFNAIPVFADIEEDFFCLDPKSVESKITENTKAIMVVDLFGQPYNHDEISKIAEKYKLKIIEDASQAPGAKYNDSYAGTLGDVGIFSLNYHKHIHCGEGGIIVTDDDQIAEKLKLIRNHAESVVESKGQEDIVNMLGFNFRMTEIEAAIAREQLKKLDYLLEKRLEKVEYISSLLKQIPCIEVCKVRENTKHAFYVQPMIYREDISGVDRNKFIEAVKAELMHTELRETEGVKIGVGYVKPIYWSPMYQKKLLYGNQGCPFKCPLYQGEVDYSYGLCPVCESMHKQKLVTHEFIHPFMKKEDMDDVYSAFKKVWDNREELV